jgi:Ca-activated chloride channel family protein
VRGAIVGVAALVAVVVLPTIIGGWPWGAECDRTETIRVSSSTEKAGIVDELVKKYNDDRRVIGDVCARADMSALSSGSMKNELADGMQDPPDVWLPTSSMWLRLLEHEGHGNLFAPDSPPRSIATSTLVIAMPQPAADALEARGVRLDTWANVLTLAQKGWAAYGKPEWRDFILGRDNAESSTSGLAATVATYLAASGGDITLERLGSSDVVAFAHDIESSVLRYGDEAVRFMQEIYDAEQQKDPATYRPEVDALVVQEQMAYLYNRGAPGGEPTKLAQNVRPRYPLRVLHPTDGTLALDHPFVVLGSPSPDRRAVAENFYEFLTEGEQQARFAEAGFRMRDDPGRQTAQLEQTLGAQAQALKFVEIPDAELLAAMQDSWDQVRRKARVLVVVDVSGSMNDIVDDPEGPDPTKLQKLIPAVQECGLDFLDDTDEVGLWTFSSDPAYTEVMPVSRLGDVRDELKARIQGLTATGNTALYEVTDKASEMMAQTWDPERINAIVLLSDGQNTEPYPGGAQALLDELDSPEQEISVRIFTVPYGHAENADVDTLAAIARITKAAYYDATNPLDVCGAFVQVFRNFG